METEKIEIELPIFSGYEPTGEYRTPKKGEKGLEMREYITNEPCLFDGGESGQIQTFIYKKIKTNSEKHYKNEHYRRENNGH